MEETCLDALVYPAATFFCGDAADLLRGFVWGDADLVADATARIDALNAPRARKARKAA